ncbi:unnamed protein product [Didymodactylos carnosus]|uniref:Uncharacterized protein n=1 Tax=Didymodactylos carnosus TaxID=1234261 RepID=A0A8S2NH54_9BILA|nr:unnamed protein product [Didymodactylos carnosus]CAF4000740.1 unnamed protein product [Didymodactylos carnosus]
MTAHITSTHNKCKQCEQGVFNCTGCKSVFCKKHFIEHRQQLSIEFDHIIYDHDLLRQQILEPSLAHSSDTRTRALNKIDAREADTIQRISNAAEQARQKVHLLVDATIDDVKRQFQKVSTEVRTAKEEENYVESTLDHWRQQLAQMKDQLETPTATIVVNGCQVEWSSMISVSSEQVTYKVASTKPASNLLNTRPTTTVTESCSTLFNGDVGLDVSLAELPDWHIIYDHPYSRRTQTAELRQLAQQYSNKRIIVGAICGRESTTLTLAAMGPADILTLDTPLDKLFKYKNVY